MLLCFFSNKTSCARQFENKLSLLSLAMFLKTAHQC